MIWIFHPQDLIFFFKAPPHTLAFLPAVEQWTDRVFGLPPADFLPCHGTILTAMRSVVGGTTQESKERHARTLIPLLKQQIRTHMTCNSNNNNKVELISSLARVLFGASVEALFGRAFIDRHGEDALRDAFFEFEAGFELAASPLPHTLLPGFRRAKKFLLKAFTSSLLEHRDFDTEASQSSSASPAVCHTLVASSHLPLHVIPNMLLAVLWASQANTIPSAFWALSYLLRDENKVNRAMVLKELRQQQPSHNNNNNNDDDDDDDDDDDSVITVACDSNSFLSCCVLEAVRLRSASTDVRIAASDFVLPGTNKLVKKGCMVLMCPWISHVDERLYGDDALEFNPHRCRRRRSSSGDTGMGVLHGRGVAGVGGLGGFAFGGGAFRCPGRSFAEMELGLVVGMVLRRIPKEVVLSDKDVPGPDVTKLVGVKVPMQGDGCWVVVGEG